MTRSTKYTNKEFAALSRNEDGDLIDLYESYPWLTDEQKNLVSEDDWSRCVEIEEELLVMFAEFEN